MDFAASRKALVAVDLGAQSCRVSLLRWIGSDPEIVEVHRFANAPIAKNGHLRWDIDAIFAGVIEGLRTCAQRVPEGIASIAVDGWAVDYVRLDTNGQRDELPFCYRDSRTERTEAEVHKIIPPARLYALTGVQILRINTVYQLYADKLAGTDPRLSWVNVPEYVSFLLCGRRVSEYTNATHTGLVALGTHSWSEGIFRDLGLDLGAAPEIVPSGTVLGPVRGELAQMPSLREARVIAAACHDTASAIAAIPADGDDWAFISSGTWSLVGTVLDAPCMSEEARAMNFTNLGGVGGKICFLKNVNGMWLLGQCMAEWEQRGARWALEDLIARCASLPEPAALIDIDEPELMSPGDMHGKINSQLARRGQKQMATDVDSCAALANMIFHSMAARYAEVIDWIGKITGKKLKRLFIVGGGSKNRFLNELTSRRTGLTFSQGSVESTTIGNFAVQLAVGENDWSEGKGVSAQSVARWAARLGARDLTLSNQSEAR